MGTPYALRQISGNVPQSTRFESILQHWDIGLMNGRF
jgi:hypothetical protein